MAAGGVLWICSDCFLLLVVGLESGEEVLPPHGEWVSVRTDRSYAATPPLLAVVLLLLEVGASSTVAAAATDFPDD